MAIIDDPKILNGHTKQLVCSKNLVYGLDHMIKSLFVFTREVLGGESYENV